MVSRPGGEIVMGERGSSDAELKLYGGIIVVQASQEPRRPLIAVTVVT